MTYYDFIQIIVNEKNKEKHVNWFLIFLHLIYFHKPLLIVFIVKNIS